MAVTAVHPTTRTMTAVMTFAAATTAAVATDWKRGLPTLHCEGFTLRPLPGVQNSRGNSALRKIGAVQEGILRKSFLRGGKLLDQTLWSIIDEDWYRSKAVWGGKVNQRIL